MPCGLSLAFRQFIRQPALSSVTVLVLGLGTAAATTVFTVVDAVLLRPLPYRAPDRLVTLWDTHTGKALAHEPISPVNFIDYRGLPVFEDAAAWWRPGVNLADPGLDPVRVNTVEASGNLFDVLGVGPAIGPGFPIAGPLFAPGELIVVISDRLWRARYSADRSIVGRQITLNDTAYTVAGVMPAKFHFPGDIDVWQRLRWDMTRHSRAAHFMEAVARLAPEATLAEAQSAVDTLARRLETDFAGTNAGWGSRLVPLLDEQLGYYRPALIVLFGAVSLLVVIGCLNVLSLLLARALGRDREIAVRIALGVSPRRLITQLLSEGLALSSAGAAAGIAAAAAALPILQALTPVEIPRLDEAGVDERALALGIAIAAVTTVVFGLVPAGLFVGARATADLRSGGRTSTRGARRVYSVLVAGEMALACALLVGSVLLVRTVSRMMGTPTGVDADDVLTTTIQLTRAPASGGASSPADRWRVVADTEARILDEIRRQPGVVAAGSANFLPLDAGWRNPFLIDGEGPPPRIEDAPQAQMHSVSDGYLETMGARLAEGRSFGPFDGVDGPPVVVVNATFVRRHLPQGRSVGRVVRIYSTAIGPLGFNLKAPSQYAHGGIPFEIIGIVDDVRNVPLGQAVEPALYFSTRQYPFSELFVAVRASTPGAGLTAVREALRRAAPHVPTATVTTWGDRVARRTAEPRLLMATLGGFATLAALLAALGVYGLLSWSVALGARELAIRLTLGARPARVAARVVRQTAVLVGVGLASGLTLVRAAEGLLARVLYEVAASDVVSTAAAGGLLAAAALAASVRPALRAMRVDPVEGLRLE